MTDESPLLARESSRNREYSWAAVALIFSVPALGGSLFGFDIGATSGAIAQMQSESASGVQWWQLVADTPALQGIIVSAASFGALFGSFVIFSTADVIDRRDELQIGAFLYLIGALFEVWAGMSGNWSAALGLTVLIAGRLVYGVGIGVTMHGAPTYLAEMGPSSIRGLLVSMKEVSIVLGILVGYVVGYLFSGMAGGWSYAYACSIVPSIMILGLSLAIPRSCRWLLLQNRDEESLDSLRFVFLEETVEREFEAMKQQHEASVAGRVEEDQPKNLLDPSYRAPLVAGIGLVVLQQITGQPSILSYLTTIFSDASLSGTGPIASVLVAGFKLAATLLSALAVERLGRKFLLYVGCSLMLMALTILSMLFGKSSPLSGTMILLAMFVYIGGYQISFGPITWLIISEVFPLDIRGKAVAVSVQVNFLLNAVVQFGVPVLGGIIGLNATFGIFALLTGYSIYFVKVKVPETRGLSLEQIELQFKDLSDRNQREATAEMEPLLTEQERAESLT